MQNEFTLIFPRSGSCRTLPSFPLYSPSFRRQRAVCLGTQSVLSCSVWTPCRPSVSPALHSPSTRTRTPRALLRGGGCRCFQAFSTPHLRYVFLCTTLCFLYRILFTNGSIYQGYRFEFSARFVPATYFFLGEIPPRFDGVQLTVVNSASKASVLQLELSSLLQKGAIEDIPQSDIEREFFSRYFLVPKRDGGLRPILDLRCLNFSLYKGKFKMLTMKTIMSQIQGGDWFVTIDLKDAYFHIQIIQRHRRIPSVCLRREGLPIQGPSLRPGLGVENIHEMHECCAGPFEAPGHSCAELPGRLAHSGSLQGASESSQRYCSTPHPFSWTQDERQEECAPPISANPVSAGSFGFHSDAGPFGSCPDIQFYSMSGPLQARPSCLCRFRPQAARPHGSGLPCVAPRVASHEAVPSVDEGAEVTPHCTSHWPYQGVARLLSTPFTMAGPRFSSERGKNGCDPPSPYGHDGRINDGLGSGLRRQTGEWGMDRRVPLLAHKLPGTQGCLPGFDVFCPRPRGASYHSQNGQHGGCVPHKPSGGFTVAHPGQACVPSSPLVPGQVPVLEGSSRSGKY